MNWTLCEVNLLLSPSWLFFPLHLSQHFHTLISGWARCICMPQIEVTRWIFFLIQCATNCHKTAVREYLFTSERTKNFSIFLSQFKPFSANLCRWHRLLRRRYKLPGDLRREHRGKLKRNVSRFYIVGFLIAIGARSKEWFVAVRCVSHRGGSQWE